MRYRILLLFLLASLSVYGFEEGCRANHKDETPSTRTSKKAMLQQVYVEDIEVQTGTLEAGDTLRVVVRGSLPSPAYTFEQFDVHVKEDTITVTPLARHDPDKLVTQVLVPFEEVCSVPDLKSGSYAVVAAGRTSQVSADEKIQVK